MQLQKTQQLLHSLSLHFLHHKIFNISILQQLCNQQKIHSSTTTQQIENKIILINKQFLLLKQNIKNKNVQKQINSNLFESQLSKNLYTMFNVFIFNVSAINQNYFKEIEKQLTESTASKSFQNNMNLNQTFFKDKMAVQLLKQHLQYYFEYFVQNCTFLHELIVDIQKNPQNKVTQSKLGFLESLDYLCVKYNIQNSITQKIIKILQKNQDIITQNVSKLHNNQSIKQTNKLLFSQKRQQQFFKILELNTNINFKNMFSIIDTNYLNLNPPRKIFDAGQISGKKVVENLIVRIVKRIDKGELFNEKCEEYSPFKLFLYHLMDKYFTVYYEFNLIVRGFMTEGNTFYSQKAIQMLKSIERFFRVYISVQNPIFHQIIHFVYQQLSTKYSQNSATQLIKKLILNRFLLNPSFYVLYNDPNQNEIKKYVQVANNIRLLFYKKKVQDLVEKINSPYVNQIVQISSDVCYSLEYCLKKQVDLTFANTNKSFLYINDKILKNQMEMFYNQFKQQGQSSRQDVRAKNVVTDYSLSFSLVKNDITSKNQLTSHPLLQNISEVKFNFNTNRSNNTQVKDNHSIRMMYDELKGMKSQSQIPPKSPQKGLKINRKQQNKEIKRQTHQRQIQNVSQLSRKQHQLGNQTRLHSMSLPTDRQILDELIEYRKQYGERKRILKLKIEERRSKFTKRMAVLDAFSIKFTQCKNQIQKENTTLYVHMSTYA